MRLLTNSFFSWRKSLFLVHRLQMFRVRLARMLVARTSVNVCTYMHTNTTCMHTHGPAVLCLYRCIHTSGSLYTYTRMDARFAFIIVLCFSKEADVETKEDAVATASREDAASKPLDVVAPAKESSVVAGECIEGMRTGKDTSTPGLVADEADEELSRLARRAILQDSDMAAWVRLQMTCCEATQGPRAPLAQAGNTCYLSAALQCLLHTRLCNVVCSRRLCTCDSDTCSSCMFDV